MGVLSVEVLGAAGLQQADLNGMADPYVVVRCIGRQLKTRVVRSTLSPTWDEKMEVRGCLDDFLASPVSFQVLDWDELGMHDVLGECSAKLMPELRLQSEPHCRDYTEALSPNGTGQLSFRLTWHPDQAPPLDAHAPHTASSSAAARKAMGPQGVTVPVLLPHKFDYLQEYWALPGLRTILPQGRPAASVAPRPASALSASPLCSRRKPKLLRPPSANVFDLRVFQHSTDKYMPA